MVLSHFISSHLISSHFLFYVFPASSKNENNKNFFSFIVTFADKIRMKFGSPRKQIPPITHCL